MYIILPFLICILGGDRSDGGLVTDAGLATMSIGNDNLTDLINSLKCNYQHPLIHVVTDAGLATMSIGMWYPMTS